MANLDVDENHRAEGGPTVEDGPGGAPDGSAERDSEEGGNRNSHFSTSVFKLLAIT